MNEGTSLSTAAALPQFDTLWNYGDPAGTEAKFREILPVAESSGDISYLAQLLTQIARCNSLAGKFEECHTLLDSVEPMLSPDLKLARSRYFLERGRAFNSAGRPEEAMPNFEEAYHVASEAKEMRYAIDAVHMIAIAEQDPKRQIEWNMKGIAMAEADASQRGWLGALYNNIGESYASLKEYPKALEYFQKLAAIQKEKGGETDIYTTKDIAKMQRLLGRPDLSRSLMAPLVEKLVSDGQDDGWMRQELAEAMEATGDRDGARLHFQKAYELLRSDNWFVENEPEGLNRLQEMARM